MNSYVCGYNLSPMGNDKAKSYYGTARVIEKENGEKVLLSYDTEVCKITKSGEFVRLWDGYSATTMRHVNSFLLLFDIAGGGKSWWEAQIVHGPRAVPVTTQEEADKVPAGYKAVIVSSNYKSLITRSLAYEEPEDDSIDPLDLLQQWFESIEDILTEEQQEQFNEIMEELRA